mgnify:CR=1 FL=1
MNSQDIAYWQSRPITDDHRDWKNKKENWVEDYWASWNHPHRKIIIEELKKLPKFNTLLEIGCNCGPNLSNIKLEFNGVNLFGIDANPDAVKLAQEKLTNDDIRVGDFSTLPWFDKSMNVVISDAALMYIHPTNLQQTLRELVRVGIGHLLLIERQPTGTQSELTNAVWAHPFEQIFKGMGYQVEARKLTEEEWPDSENWKKYGHVIKVTL